MLDTPNEDFSYKDIMDELVFAPRYTKLEKGNVLPETNMFRIFLGVNLFSTSNFLKQFSQLLEREVSISGNDLYLVVTFSFLV